MKQRIGCRLASGAFTALVLVAGSPAGAAAAEPLVIAQAAHAFTFVPLYVAEKGGFFREEGLDAELLVAAGGAQARAAVVGGSAAIGSAPPIEIAQAFVAGQKLLFFASMNNEFSQGVLVHKDFARERGIGVQAPLSDRIRALKGARLSVTSSGSMTDHFLRFLLRSEKLDPDRDVSIVPMGGDASAALIALERRAIDGLVHAPPAFEMAEHRGYGLLLISGLKGEIPDLRGLQFTGLYTTRAYAEKNGPRLVRVVKAVGRALRLIHTDTGRARALARTYFEKIPAPVFDLAWDRMTAVWPPDPTVNRDGIQVAISFYNTMSAKPLQVRFEDFATNRYVEEAQR